MAIRKQPAPKDDDTGSIRVGKATQKRLKVYAATAGLEMRQIADTALDEYLKKRGA
jgi:hypothetical protein